MKFGTSLLTSTLVFLAATAQADQLKILASNESALMARYGLIKTAKKEILAEYYEIANDDTSTAGLALLLEAAQRGVKVKLLIDNMHNELQTQEMAAVTNTLNSISGSKNFEIKVFNPLSSPNVLKLTYRNHDKLLAVDGESMIVGGRNVADGYFGRGQKMNFRDMDILVTGESAQKARDYFMTLWEKNPMVKSPQYNQHSEGKLDSSQCFREKSSYICENQIENSLNEVKRAQNQILDVMAKLNTLSVTYQPQTALELVKGGDQVDIGFLFNDPTKVMAKMDNRLADQIFRYIKEKTRKTLTIVTPYLYPTEEAMDLLKELSSQGIKVRLITNSLASTDTPLAQAAYESVRAKFRDANVDVYEYAGKETLHMKVTVIDAGTANAAAMIGSFNLDRRSALINREIAFLIQGPSQVKVANEVQAVLDQVLSSSIASIQNGQDVNQAELESLLQSLGPAAAQSKRDALEKNRSLVNLLKDQI